MKDRSRIYRLFAAALSEGPLALDESESHHAANVLRLKAGADVELFDGRGGVAAGWIQKLSRGRVEILVGAVQRKERIGPMVHLAFATPKGNRLDWLLEKATELGAASLRPVIFQRSVAGPKAESDFTERWLKHCIAAAKQSGLNFLPEILPAMKLDEFLTSCAAPVRLLGSAADDAAPISDVLRSTAASPAEIALLVGPEGGLNVGEYAAAVAGGFKPARLGRTTLRIETAAVALLAAVMAVCDSKA